VKFWLLVLTRVKKSTTQFQSLADDSLCEGVLRTYFMYIEAC